MELGLQGRVVIVTGASAGIGRSTADQLVEEGADVLLCARREEPLEAVATELRGRGGGVRTVAADVTDPASSNALVEAALGWRGRIDAVVHAAGASDGRHLRDFQEDAWMAAYQLNTLSAVRLSMACVPAMQERRWGRIVTVASTAARDPDPRFAAYGAAKAALLHATRALSRTYSRDGILVNCVLPGLTRTESVLAGYQAVADRKGADPDDVERRMLERQPVAMGRTGEPSEVAAAITFLCSEAASWMTGALVPVDGGTLRDLP